MQSQYDSRILCSGKHERGAGREPTGSVEAMSARNSGFPRWLNRGEAENAASIAERGVDRVTPLSPVYYLTMGACFTPAEGLLIQAHIER